MQKVFSMLFNMSSVYNKNKWTGLSYFNTFIFCRRHDSNCTERSCRHHCEVGVIKLAGQLSMNSRKLMNDSPCFRQTWNSSSYMFITYKVEKNGSSPVETSRILSFVWHSVCLSCSTCRAHEGVLAVFTLSETNLKIETSLSEITANVT